MSERPRATGRMVPVSAPPRVRDLVSSAPAGPVRVVHRGPQAVYVDVGGRCIGVLAAGAALVPCGLRTRRRDLMALQGDSAHVERGVLHIDCRPLTVGRVVDVFAPRLDRGTITQNTTNSVTALVTPPAAVVEFAASVAPHGIDRSAVSRLLGRGEGLTPLGDDVLCGWLAAHRAAGVATPEVDAEIRALVHRTTLLSATLLDCASCGEVLPELGDYFTALGTGAERHRAAALLAVGSTSGAGLMAGTHLALAEHGREGTWAP